MAEKTNDTEETLRVIEKVKAIKETMDEVKKDARKD